jgi:hypothetical protein
LAALVQRVAEAVDRHRGGELDAFEVDQVIFQYQRAARQLWTFCQTTGSRAEFTTSSGAWPRTARPSTGGNAASRTAADEPTHSPRLSLRRCRRGRHRSVQQVVVSYATGQLVVEEEGKVAVAPVQRPGLAGGDVAQPRDRKADPIRPGPLAPRRMVSNEVEQKFRERSSIHVSSVS